MRIKTARCLLRPFEEKDIDRFMDYRNNQEWMQYQGLKGLSKSDYRKLLLKETSLIEGQQLAIVLISSDQLIGDIYLRQELNTCWLGYTIHPDFARKGYAKEVVSGVIDYLRGIGFVQVKAGILPGNVASKGLVKTLGFTFSGMEEEEEVYLLPL